MAEKETIQPGKRSGKEQAGRMKIRREFGKLYKILDEHDRAIHGGDYHYDPPKDGKPGTWTTSVTPYMCNVGYHVTSIDGLSAWIVGASDYNIYEVDVRGRVFGNVARDRKVVCESIRLKKLVYSTSNIKGRLGHKKLAMEYLEQICANRSSNRRSSLEHYISSRGMSFDRFCKLVDSGDYERIFKSVLRHYDHLARTYSLMSVKSSVYPQGYTCYAARDIFGTFLRGDIRMRDKVDYYNWLDYRSFFEQPVDIKDIINQIDPNYEVEKRLLKLKRSLRKAVSVDASSLKPRQRKIVGQIAELIDQL